MILIGMFRIMVFCGHIYSNLVVNGWTVIWDCVSLNDLSYVQLSRWLVYSRARMQAIIVSGTFGRVPPLSTLPMLWTPGLATLRFVLFH